MSLAESILLGLIQGITEFLPVSSSGHLVLTQRLLGFSQPPIFFDILIHTATLVAVFIYFRKKIVSYINYENIKNIIIASLPAVFFGLILSPYVESIYNSIPIVGVGLLVTGSFMLYTKNIKGTSSKTINLNQAIKIGSFQALALFPGISRSGSTIFGGLLSKVDREKAFEFSFILSIPAIIGAMTLQLFSTNINPINAIDIMGFMAALFSGLFAIRILDAITTNNKLFYFGYYCLLVGIGSLVSSI